jgi:hypothetical protein
MSSRMMAPLSNLGSWRGGLLSLPPQHPSDKQQARHGRFEASPGSSGGHLEESRRRQRMDGDILTTHDSPPLDPGPYLGGMVTTAATSATLIHPRGCWRGTVRDHTVRSPPPSAGRSTCQCHLNANIRPSPSPPRPLPERCCSHQRAADAGTAF